MAAAVLILGLVAMISTVTSGARVLDVAQKQTVASQIIRSEIERIHGSEFSLTDQPTPQDPTPITSPVTVRPEFAAIGPLCTCNETTTLIQPGLKQVTITVTWRGNTGQNYTRTDFTYWGKNGLYVAYQH